MSGVADISIDSVVHSAHEPNFAIFLGSSWLALIAALLLDHWLGETTRFHPLAGFGLLAQRLERRLNSGTPAIRFFCGAASWMLLVLPLPIMLFALRPTNEIHVVFDAIIVYFCIGFRSLHDHTTPIAQALIAYQHSAVIGDEIAQADSLAEARRRVSWIVSRDTATMDENQCARAAIESLLENGNDALFATLFWYVVAGPAGAVLHRLANTLDAMWGYRTQRFEYFGKWAARTDDLLAWLPARMTAVSYSLAGNFVRAVRCWCLQARHLSSPNGGPCMTAGAGSLGVTLGGPCHYHGLQVDKPFFGEGPRPEASDIVRAQHLLARALMIWVLVISLFYWAVPS